jgi:hypothetical protein
MKPIPEDPRLDRLAAVLELIIEVSGLSRIELARRLGSDYPVRRILGRHKEIRLRQLLRFADAVEMKPLEIFKLALAADGEEPSPLLHKLGEDKRLLNAVLARLEPQEPGSKPAGDEREPESPVAERPRPSGEHGGTDRRRPPRT